MLIHIESNTLVSDKLLEIFKEILGDESPRQYLTLSDAEKKIFEDYKIAVVKGMAGLFKFS